MKNVHFGKDILIVPEIFNKLNVVEENEEFFLRGSLDVIDGTGRIWDTYEVEIKGSESYPYAFPKLFETNNAFPKNADWHVYENDFSCCVDVTPNELIICKNGLKVVEYIQQYTIPYLANQTYRIREGYYLYGEYSHGIIGRIEFYQSKLKARDPMQLLSMFDFIIKNYNPDRRAMCPFCHKEKFRRCHQKVFIELAQIKEFLIFDMQQLFNFFILNKGYKLPKIESII